MAELVLALAITSLIAAAVTTMLFSTSYGAAAGAETRSLVVAGESILRRLAATIAPAAEVLAAGDDYLVLWMAEKSANGAPNLSELVRIERDPDTDELYCYRAPADLAPEADTTYSLESTDFNAVTAALKGSESFPGALWGTDVTDWTTALNDADPRQATFVGYRVTLTLEGESETFIGGTALMNR